MSSTFSSRTYNFNTLLGRSSFPDYSTKKVVIPKFQRGYSWEKSHVATFWEDIWEFHENVGAADTYFLGPVVILPETNQITILDGQQRLATATILFSVIRDIARQKGGPKGADLARDIQRDLILIDDEDETFALSMSALDAPYFSAYIQQDPPDEDQKAKIRSHRLIRQARKFLFDSVSGEVEGKQAGKIVADLKKFRNSIAEKLKLVIIEVGSEEEAYQIFETLNDRGLRLSVPDLLLNHLMRTAPSSAAREAIRSYWNEIIETTGIRRVSTFLRHMWVSKHGDVKSQGLFREIRKHLTDTAATSRAFAKDAASECVAYSKIITCDKAALKGAEPSINAIVKSLSEDKALPALLSAYQCMSENDFEKFSRYAAALVVRYSIIANLNPSVLEDTLYAAARLIRTEKEKKRTSATILKKAKVELSKINPDIGVLRASLEDVYLTKPRAKLLLTGIADKQQSPTKAVAMNKVSIEHIYPENAKKADWPDKDDLDQFIWHLGNLSLLEPKLNKEAGNKKYPDKVDIYKKSEITMSTDIEKKYSSWGQDEILKRAKAMAKLIDQVWVIPK